MKTESEPEWIEDIRETLELCDGVESIEFQKDGHDPRTYSLKFSWNEQPFEWQVSKYGEEYGFDNDGSIYPLDDAEVFRLIACELLQRNSRLEDENHRMGQGGGIGRPEI